MSTTKMRPIRETIALDEALAVVAEATRPLERTERVRLANAGGRVAARDAASEQYVPPFDRAAMDGFAVVAEDTFGAGRYDPSVLRCVETVFTGQTPRRGVSRGECAQIATGAPMPHGADAVVMVEGTDRSDTEVRIFTPVYPRQNVGRRGADIVPGQTLVTQGSVLSPGRIGALAAVGIAEVEVYAKPSVALLSTGDEIVAPGQALAPGQIYDINRYTMEAIVRSHGATAVGHPTAADTLDALSAAVDACAAHDLLVFSGGSSVGERDLIVDVLQERGEVLFHGIAVKPGKPMVFGRIGETPVLGMPGYPTSCLSNAYMLLVPILRRLAQLPAHRPRTVTAALAERVVSTTGRHQFYTVRLEDGRAVPAFKASGDITSMSLADGYIEIPAQTDIVEKGETVVVKLFVS
ncbi:MAG: molybdopterin molybdotransferase MoeA [Vicinamibacterales bacterium]|jgi:molybdenum cofactor synthesis domain-containing protein|nr:molybdenum cofactor biosynthesis protein [Acidobacteriota bacterium]MDP6373850.1 molybdopterin molybdotransferase MoeA [Vicinamibacterales bacterium]MDP6607767.1 molybdopterin molybdotransferase MoeA [Vicinamibacterales bacterium]|tara:strand:- start:1447 stop:2673 length:1227 start_codon:yes stop_codon:yes gene_type:complete